MRTEKKVKFFVFFVMVVRFGGLLESRGFSFSEATTDGERKSRPREVKCTAKTVF
jgi:hypothetical protein